MRVTWIGGWGVAPESLRPLAEIYFPKSKHAFLAPTTGGLEFAPKVGRVTPCAPLFETTDAGAHGVTRPTQMPDVLVAWSLGAWHVLEAASRGVEFSGMVLLLAPFVAFPSESHLGGKCSTTQVKFLRRWLQREPLAALADFYQRAGLPQPQAGLQVGRVTPCAPSFDIPSSGAHGVTRPTWASELPYALPDLLEGLDRLSEDAAPALREFASRGLPRNWQMLIGDDDPLLDAEAVQRSLPGCVRLRGAGHAIADLLRASQAK